MAGHVLNEAAVAHHVEDLEATADAEDRQVALDRRSRDLDLERDHALGPSPRHAVHELHPIAIEARQRPRQVVDDVAHVMERRPAMLGHELRDSRLAVHRLDELDPLLLVPEEHDANALVRELADWLGGEPERVAKEGKGVFDARYGDRDVMQRAELHRRGGTYVPNT